MSGMNSPFSTCGCCQGPCEHGPVVPQNRPGLAQLAYRLGRHGDFKSCMLAAISKQESLHRLGTRRDDDFTIGLMDSWAMVLDVLTFYQERLANEAFLRTAVQRRSLLELSRLIGYRLGPGVSAGALLAFTLDDKPGSPESVTIAAGTRAQSLPIGQDELPQSFETNEELLAEARWNILQPRRTVPQDFDLSTLVFYVEGAATGLQTGDPMLLVVDNDDDEQVLLRVQSLEPDAENNRTLVTCLGASSERPSATSGLSTELFEPELTEGEALDAAAEIMAAMSKAGPGPMVMKTAEALFAAIVDVPEADYAYQYMFDAELAGWSAADLIANILATLRGSLDSDLGLYALKVSSPTFGHNAPRYATLLDTWSGEFANNWDDPDGDLSYQGWPLADNSVTGDSNSAIHLAQAHDKVLAGDWVVLTDSDDNPQYFRALAASTRSMADFGLSGEATRVELVSPSGSVVDYDDLGATFKLRDTSIHSASDYRPLADLLVAEVVETMPAGTMALQVEEVVPNLEPGRHLILEGELADDPGVYGREELVLAWIEQGAYTRLVFTEGLTQSYTLSTVRIHANVVTATHGESRAEVLGSGDGGEPFQRFILGQSPLTHVSAATSSGGESTLALEIDGILWHETASLYTAGPRDRVFVTRQRDDGTTEVRFGDGRRGARLPSGSENLVAGYRVGIGHDGMVDAGQISLLATRPLGVKEVVNPLASSGAEDAETRDEARQNAPLTVLTLDRVVSLQDFEDFARAFSGIGKARADWVWDGTRRVVHLTVAAPNGAELSSTVLTNLEEALDAAREPSQPLIINESELLYFSIDLRLKVHPDHDWDRVTEAVEAGLGAAFSFTARDFAQRAADSEVIALVQNITGVVAVDLDGLTELTSGVTADPFGLPARPARYDEFEEEIHPAQLLTLAPATAEPVTIVEMT